MTAMATTKIPGRDKCKRALAGGDKLRPYLPPPALSQRLYMTKNSLIFKLYLEGGSGKGEDGY
jgi:hypothetical protein